MHKFDAAVFTSRGGHPVNEDAARVLRAEGPFAAAVADGLGSHGGGDIAAAAAVEAAQSGLPPEGIADPAALRRCLELANAAVLARQRPGVPMKSTLVLLAAERGRAAFAHVGDSRGYFFRGGRVACQTMDHSVSQLAVLRGNISPAQIRFHESRSRLLRALGAGETAGGELTPLPPPEAEDAFLLCTDGFWEYVTEGEMEIDLAKAPSAAAWLSAMLARIGGRVPDDHDNLSAVAVLYGGTV